MKRYCSYILLFGLLLLLSGCARQYDIDVYEPAGFFQGLWHGLIAPFAFVGSRFDSTVAIYDAGNNGFWYNLGYILGLICTFGTGSSVYVHEQPTRKHDIDDDVEQSNNGLKYILFGHSV